MDDVLGVEMLQGDQDLGDEELGDPLRESPHLTGQDHLQHVTCMPVIGYMLHTVTHELVVNKHYKHGECCQHFECRYLNVETFYLF